MGNEQNEINQEVGRQQKTKKTERNSKIKSSLEKEIRKFKHVTVTQAFGIALFTLGSSGFIYFADSIGEGRRGESAVQVLRGIDKEPEVTSEVLAKRQDSPRVEIKPTAINEQSRLIKNVFANSTDFEYAAINAKVGLYKKEVKADVDLDQMKFFLKGWGDHLEIQAKKHNLDPEIVKGMILIESSGNPEAVSPTGAVGVAQLMPAAAERFDVNPENSYEAVIGMCEYLDELRSHFAGDMGMAIWAYHAGEGNVMNALRYYFMEKHNFDIGNYEKSLSMPTDEMRLKIEGNARGLIKKHKVTAFQLFRSEAVQDNVLADLEDDTQNYVHKAIAGAMLLKD